MNQSQDAVTRSAAASWRAVHGPALFVAINSAVQMASGATGATLLMHGTRQDVVLVCATDGESACLEEAAPESPATKALLDGDVVVVDDVTAAAANDPWCRLAQTSGVGSAAGLPLTVGTGTIGAVGLYHPTPGRFGAGGGVRSQILVASAAQALAAELLGRGLHRAIEVDVPPWPRAGDRWRGIVAVTPVAEGLALLRGLAAEQSLAAVRRTSAQAWANPRPQDRPEDPRG